VGELVLRVQAAIDELLVIPRILAEEQRTRAWSTAAVMSAWRGAVCPRPSNPVSVPTRTTTTIFSGETAVSIRVIRIAPSL